MSLAHAWLKSRYGTPIAPLKASLESLFELALEQHFPAII